MSLVGDIIMDLRARIPDAPPVAPPALVGALGSVNIPGGSFAPGSTIYLVSTSVTAWGESMPSFEQSVSIAPGNNAIQFTLTPYGSELSANVYFGPAPGQESGRSNFAPGSGNVYILTGAPSTVQSATPPTHSTAFLPDSDGNFIGAYTAYRLLNRALQEMVRIAGGIIDVTGVQSTVNQSMYRLDSPFYQFINAWYDGYPMDVVQRSMMYLRNSAAGFSGILSYEQDGPQSVIQVWPQSNRTGGQSFTLGELFAANQGFIVGSGGQNFLSIGLARIENEIVAYSQVQPVQTLGIGTVYQFSGVLRGMGGTDAVDHPPGSIVQELNIRLSGYRMARTYNVGDSALNIQVPQAWETPLVLHMLSQVRSMEQDDAASKSLMGDFVQMVDKIAKQSRMGKLKPRQIPIWGQTASDARNVNGIGFGWLIN